MLRRKGESTIADQLQQTIEIRQQGAGRARIEGVAVECRSAHQLVALPAPHGIQFLGKQTSGRDAAIVKALNQSAGLTE